ncbi:RNA helicase [Lecanora helva]
MRIIPELHYDATKSSQGARTRTRERLGRAGFQSRNRRGDFTQNGPSGFHDADRRAGFLRPATFIPWLISRLRLIEKTSSDQGYATFARNLIAILPNKSIRTALAAQNENGRTGSQWHPSEHSRPLSLLNSLRAAFNSHGESGVDTQLRYSYHGLLTSRKFSKTDVEDQEKLADLRYPVEWYPATRTLQRKIILHVGPTNSGKTYHALKRLEQAKSGIFAGPLRLLAHEVYTRLNAQGRTCNLVTGDEKATHEGAEMQSCTVEMVPLNANVDVAVIDEIQMIGHRDRGWAWTQALLGLKSKEIHLCGEERSVPLIREIVASMGDEIEIHTYKRLSPLKTMSTSLQGKLKNLRKGDCVVVFSRVAIHNMKREIERLTQKRVAVVYGSLPPEIRAQQARLFNDPENDYDIIVASDAIGMGLNLAIKRIVFESVSKFNGVHTEIIEHAQLKQIAGRAGRYRTIAQAEPQVGHLENAQPESTNQRDITAPPPLGLVTTLYAADLPVLRKAMQAELDPIMSAGILPPTNILTRFATYFPPSTNFHYILLRLHELSLQHPRYHLCDLKNQTAIADIIQPVQSLTVHDRIVFCASPANPKRSSRMASTLRAFARCVGEHKSGALLDIPELLLDVLDEEMKLDRAYMERLESLHMALILYLWLSYRFAGVFINQGMAFYVKGLVEEKIDKLLAEYSASPAIREQIRRLREQALRQVSKLNRGRVMDQITQPQDELPHDALVLDDRSVQSPYNPEENAQARPMESLGHEA